MKVKMLQVVSPEIMDYAQYTVKINRAYCNLQGYEYILYKNIDTNRHPAWSKIKGAIENINTCDLLFILDADAYVQNHLIRVEKFLNNNRPIQMCCNGENGGELLNSGAIIIRKGKTADMLLKSWWKAGENHKKAFVQFWEQDILNSLHNSGKDVPLNKVFKENIYVHGMRDFNSHWLDMEESNLNPNQFVQHLMARSIEDKTSFVKNYYKKIM